MHLFLKLSVYCPTFGSDTAYCRLYYRHYYELIKGLNYITQKHYIYCNVFLNRYDEHTFESIVSLNCFNKVLKIPLWLFR